MDSYADLQTVNEHHDHHDVNPPPPPLLPLHPPYSEMIIAAICALKDKDGSSRQAIAKYIEKEYMNLPPTHPTLLTNHLKRMKNEGELIMVKHSYMLPPPRSSVSPFQDHHYSVTSIDNSFAYADVNADANANASADVTADVGSNVNTDFLTPRRKPGRPPKPRQDFGFQPNLGGVQDFQPQTDDGAPQQQEALQGGAEPVFASLVVSAKRGRGRPPKSVASASAAGAGDVGGSGEVVEQEKKKPGRPKSMSVGGVRRGRPKRIGGSGPLAVPLSGDAARPSGRPKRSVTKPQTMYDVNGGGVETGSVSRGRGRPPKSKQITISIVCAPDKDPLKAYSRKGNRLRIG
nr:hypothetical protein [Tanacetum cinerariifolium]